MDRTSICSSILLLTFLEHLERKTLLQVISTSGKIMLKVKFCLKFFTTINLFLCRGHLMCSGEIEIIKTIKNIWKIKVFHSCSQLKLLHYLPSLLCYLFMQENVQTNIKGKILHTFGIDKLCSGPFQKFGHSKLLIFEPSSTIFASSFVFTSFYQAHPFIYSSINIIHNAINEKSKEYQLR